ncbi:hypothetical protein V1517DRAFT_310381 [Lipomyces orientalis]|uniref:Uncharacterized protein n=1 Tax=Lipomyces orientalis TaxID=1233043 RepID=A0ACC3TIA9_9ASCO
MPDSRSTVQVVLKKTTTKDTIRVLVDEALKSKSKSDHGSKQGTKRAKGVQKHPRQPSSKVQTKGAVAKAAKLTKAAQRKSKRAGTSFNPRNFSCYTGSILRADSNTLLALRIMNSTLLELDTRIHETKVINKSDVFVPYNVNKLLCFNSKFIPAPKPKAELVPTAFEKFKNRLRWHYFWITNQSKLSADNFIARFYIPSHRKAPRGPPSPCHPRRLRLPTDQNCEMIAAPEGTH